MPKNSVHFPTSYTIELDAEEIIMLHLAMERQRDYYADCVAKFEDDDDHSTPLFWKERLEMAEKVLEKVRRM
jgi:hypothetical protein